MATFEAISEVSSIIAHVLDTDLQLMQPTPGNCIVHDLLGPRPTGMVLTLTLYDVGQDPSMRNRPDRRSLNPITNKLEIRREHCGLLLRYLITAWSGSILDDQLLIGRGVQALYDNAIIGGPQLVLPTGPTSLLAADEAVAVTMIPQTIEDRTHVWRAYNKDYRLSVHYEVRVVKIESRRLPRIATQVESRHNHHAAIEENP